MAFKPGSVCRAPVNFCKAEPTGILKIKRFLSMIKMYTVFFYDCNKTSISQKLIIAASQPCCCTARLAYGLASTSNYFN